MKTNKSIFIFFILTLTLSGISSGKYSGGMGEPNDPYLIATPNDLCDINSHIEDYNKHFIMVNDINMTDFYDTNPVFMISGDFVGVFDGNSHSISNFRGTEGLFERLGDEPGILKNLALIDVNLTGSQPGGLVRENYGLISNCSVTGKVTDEFGYCVGGLVGWSNGVVEDSFADCIVNGEDVVGGLVGRNQGDISRCSTSGAVSGHSTVGGLTGDNYDCTISDSCSTCSISAVAFAGGLTGFNMGIILNCHTTDSNVVDGDHDTGGLVGGNAGLIQDCWSSGCYIQTYFKYAGGLVGHNFSDGRIIACFANNRLSGDTGIGGLAGLNESVVEDCYSSGNVDANENAGGLIGSITGSPVSRSYSCASVSQGLHTGMFAGYSYSSESGIQSCFWDTVINPDMNGIGNTSDPDLIGLPTAQMQMRSTFVDAGWDMVNIWDIGENQTYPFMRKHLPSDINKDSRTDFYDLAILAEHWLGQ